MSRLLSVRRIAAAVRPLDSFTGLPPENGNVRVVMEDGAVPVIKPEGYYIFWDNGSRKRILLAEGEGYERERLEIDVQDLERKRQPTVCLWLTPGRSYSYPPGVKLVEELGYPGETRTFPLEQSAGCIRFMEPYPCDRLNPRLIRLMVPADMELEGRRLCMRNMDGDEEYASIWSVKNRAMGMYELAEPLRYVYGPYESGVLLTLSIKADGEGRLLLPVNC